MLYSSRYPSTRGVLWCLKINEPNSFSTGASPKTHSGELPAFPSRLGPPGQGGAARWTLALGATDLRAATAATGDIVNKGHVSPKLSPKIHSLSAALWSCELSQEQSGTLGCYSFQQLWDGLSVTQPKVRRNAWSQIPAHVLDTILAPSLCSPPPTFS